MNVLEFLPTNTSSSLDLSNCASEPIHVPGAIQPHGALLAALAEGLLVTHASANLEEILGRTVEEVLGRSLENALGEAACETLLDVSMAGGVAPDRLHSLTLPDGSLLYLRAHRTGRHICVDLEPGEAQPLQQWPIFRAKSVVATFWHAASVVELCELAVQGLKTISGYDRVMAYRFSEDGHGEVIAEARDASLKAYLGQHYPASDVPTQARRLYLSERVGAIADCSYIPVPVCTDPALDEGAPLDLTHSTLRSVSPVHREYMRNMNTRASLTIGLAYGQDLWGMLVCHHTQPRRAGFELRAAADMIGHVVSLLLVSTGEAELLTQRLERTSTLRALIERLTAPTLLPKAFAAAQVELLHLMNATGCMVRLSGTLIGLGCTPSPAVTKAILAVLQPMTAGEVLAIDDLSVRYPEFADSIGEACGVMLLPLASDTDDLILWFRPEMERTIVWGGNPTTGAIRNPTTGRISPRSSFDAWKETVKAHCMPWSALDLAQTREVRVAVAAEVGKRAMLALRESQAELGLIVEHSSDVILLMGLDGTRQYVSSTVQHLLGWRPEEMVGPLAILGSKSEDFVHPEDIPIIEGILAPLLAGNIAEYSVCFRHLCRDGSWLWVDSRSRLRTSTDGASHSGTVITLSNATDRKRAEIKLKEALEQMERMAATDGLTGLANRRHFDFVVDTEWRRCRREHQPLSLLLLDTDHFKLFNDRYGHLAGDGCLRAIASQLELAARRPADLAARYGGEEFLLLMPHTDRDGAWRVAERVREHVLKLAIEHEESLVSRFVTVSVGVATAWPASADSEGASDGVARLLAAADAALYQAKNTGRNKVVADAD